MSQIWSRYRTIRLYIMRRIVQKNWWTRIISDIRIYTTPIWRWYMAMARCSRLRFTMLTPLSIDLFGQTKHKLYFISLYSFLYFLYYSIVWKKDSFISNSGTLLVFLSASIFYMCVLNFYFFLSERGILFQTLHKYIRILYICVLNYYICICNQEIELFLLKFNQDDVREGKYYSKVQSTNWLLLTHDNTAIWNKKYTHTFENGN